MENDQEQDKDKELHPLPAWSRGLSYEKRKILFGIVVGLLIIGLVILWMI